MDTRKKPKIGLILGSNRPNRIGRSVAEWVVKAMANEQLQLDIIDLAKIELPFLNEPDIPAHGNYQLAHTKKWSQLIQQYDGFVFLFPQYNWGYPAVLKNALDYLYREWSHKPVSIMVYGNHGGFQGLLAMKLVTQGLKMYNMATNPPLDIKEEMFDEQGQFINIDTAFAHLKQPMQAVSAEFVELLKEQEH